MAKQVEFELNAAMSKYDRSMKTAMRTASQFDAQMRDLQKTAKAVDKQLGQIDGKVKVDVTADTGALDRAEGKVDAIDGMTPKVTLGADVSALDKAEGKIDAIDGRSPDVTVEADTSALDKSEGKIDAIDGATPKVTVQSDDSALADLRNQISKLNTTATVSLVLQGASFARETFDSTPVLGNIQDQQAAMRLLESSGNDTAEAMEAIGTVWQNNWGASKVEIAGVVDQLAKLGVTGDLDDAALSVFELNTKVGDLNTTLAAQSVLVRTGVAGSFREAADIIATGLNGPAGTAEDFLDTIKEYAPQLDAIGFSADSFLAFLNSGMEQGAFNTDKLADSLKEMNIRVQEAVATGEGAAAEALARVGQTDEAEAYANGQLSGDQFVTGVLNAIAEKGTDFDLFEIFGSGAEDLGAELFANIDFEGASDLIPEGAAAEMANALTDTVGNDWTALMRTMSDGFLGVIDDMTGGIDGWIEEVQTKIETLTSELQSGTALPEALEIALEAPGLSDKIRDFEAGVGRFIIEFLNGVAMLVDAIPGGNAEPLRGTVADLAAGQLEFELKFADNGAEIEAAVTNAIDRGVSEADVQAAVNNVVMGLIDENQLVAAQTIVDKVLSLASTTTPTQTTTEVGFSLFGQGASTEISQTTAGLQGLDLSETQAAIDDTRASLDETTPVLETAIGMFTDWADQAYAATTNLQKMDDPIASVEFGAENVTAATDKLVDSLSDLEEGGPASVGALVATIDANGDGVVTWLETATRQVEALNDKLALAAVNMEILANSGGGGAGGEFTKTDGSHAGGLPEVPFDGYIAELHAGEAVLTAQEASVWRSLFMDLPALSGGGSSVVNNTTINVNTNIQSHGAAQLMGNTGRVARSIRGF